MKRERNKKEETKKGTIKNVANDENSEEEKAKRERKKERKPIAKEKDKMIKDEWNCVKWLYEFKEKKGSKTKTFWVNVLGFGLWKRKGKKLERKITIRMLEKVR